MGIKRGKCERYEISLFFSLPNGPLGAVSEYTTGVLALAASMGGAILKIMTGLVLFDLRDRASLLSL